MKLRELKAAIDRMAADAGDCDAEVEVWHGNGKYRIIKFLQFGKRQDVAIWIERVKASQRRRG